MSRSRLDHRAALTTGRAPEATRAAPTTEATLTTEAALATEASTLSTTKASALTTEATLTTTLSWKPAPCAPAGRGLRAGTTVELRVCKPFDLQYFLIKQHIGQKIQYDLVI